MTAPHPLLLRTAAFWVMLAIGEILLHLAMPNTPAAGLIALDLLVLLPVLALMAALHHVAGRWALAIAWIGTLAWLSSWASYWQTGLFLDREAVAFWALQPVQVFHWVYPPVVMALLAVATGLVLLLGWYGRRVEALSKRARRRLVRCAVAAVAVCVAVAAVGAVRGDWDRLSAVESPFAGASSVHAGPVVHALLDAAAGGAGQQAVDVERLDGGVRVERRRIVPTEQWVATVDRGRMRPLNVLMIQVESLRADQLRAYGGTRAVMPAIDALAREARVFTRAYIQASHSNYAGLVPLSSQYPLRSPGMYEYPANPTYPRVLIYDVLKALGYRTAVISSQNEQWGAMINFHRPESLDYFFHAATYSGPTYTPWEDIGFAQWVAETGVAGSVDDRHTVDEALRWLEREDSRPFFLHMNLQSSHLPYVVPAGFTRPFGPDALDFTILWGRFPLDRVQVVKDRYADSLNYIDTQLARLFDGLRRLGLWDNTIVVFGGDNGEAFYEHGFSAHASWLFNEVVKVPMVIRVPGASPGPDERPAMFLDVPPTLLDVLGLPPHPGFQGISLFAPQFDPERPMFMIAQTPAAFETAVVKGRYKLHWAERENLYVLNDLDADPGEQNDMAARRPDIVESLSRLLHQWREVQLGYYRDVARHATEYPPVLVE